MKAGGQWLFALGVVILAGCGEDYETVVGAIMVDHDKESLESTVPGRVTAGEPFHVTFSTWGGGCIEPSYEESEPIESGIRITPYDRNYEVGDAACTDILLEFDRQVELVFDAPGSHVIEIRGRPTTYPGTDELVILEHVVTVEE